MAKTPRPPKPKLPKPKKSLGQHLKDSTRKAAAGGLRKNFGVLGDIVARKYLAPPRVKTNIRVEPDTGNKKINKKTIKKELTPDISILESGKQVSGAVEIIASNVTRNFARASRQVDTMGVEVTKALDELSATLDKMLYRKPAQAPVADATNVPRNTGTTKEPEGGAGGGGFLGIGRWFIPLLGGFITHFLDRDSSKPGGSKVGDFMDKHVPGAAWLDEKAYNITGGLVGTKDATKIYGADPSKTKIGGAEHLIHKMNYKSDKIKFIATGKIEFKSKIKQASTTSGAAAAPRSAGFFNDLLDKVIGGRGGGGYAGGGGMDGQGGGPAASGGPEGGPKGGATPGASTPDTDYSGPGKGQYDSTKAKANFMQPGEQFGAPGSNLTQVKTQGGHSFTVHQESSEAFKRTIEDLETAGAPLGTIGGYSPRPGGIGGRGKMSQHSMGNAMDIGSQSGKDVIRKDTRDWIESHPKEWRNILDKNGMISGGDWKSPDLGHLEWSGRKPWEETKPTEDAQQTKPDKTSDATKFMDIPPENNRIMSELLPKPYKLNETWQHMRPANFDTQTGERLIDDRRNEPNPQDDDQYSRATFENEAYSRALTTARERETSAMFGQFPAPTPLGLALGGRDLAEQYKPPAPQIKERELSSWDALKPPDPTKPQTRIADRPDDIPSSSSDKVSGYEGTRDLDHRPRQDAVEQSDFSSYMDVK